MDARTYIRRLAAYALLIALAVVTFNFLVDPYAITAAPRIPHFNQYKADINDYSRLMKRYHPQQGEHTAIILGNSRAELGIDPAHRCFATNGMRVYNLALPGAELREQLDYALNIIHQQSVDTVFLSVDFIDFISPQRRPLRAQALLGRDSGELKFLPGGAENPDYWRIRLLDYYRALFTLDALASSLVTVAGQGPFAPDRDSAGFNPGNDFLGLVYAEGPRALFEQKMDSLQAKYRGRWYLRDADGQLPQAYDDVRDFLRFAGQRGIEVRLFTHPFHQRYWEFMHARGFMPLYQDWLQSIETLARQFQPTGASFWDFSGDSPYIREPLPAAGPGEPLQWFWEPAHYRRQLGDLMVEAMLSETCGTPVQLGRQLR